MSNFYQKNVEFDPYDTTAPITIAAGIIFVSVFLVIFGPIMQLPEPIGPALWLTCSISATVITGVWNWVHHRRKFLRKIHTALNLQPGDPRPLIPVIPFRAPRYFEFDGTEFRRIASQKTAEPKTVYMANSKGFSLITLLDQSPLSVWDRTLDRIDNSYSITHRRH